MKENITNLIIIFVFLLIGSFLYNRFEEKRIREEDLEDYTNIQKYLLNDTTLGKNTKKPLLWIHVPYEYNSRNWSSFGSRSSLELNQPYLYLTVKSIIQQCKDSFRICLIDDNSFEKIIPNWSINMKLISSPISDKMRTLAMTKILYIYGGITVPISFLCMKDLIGLYNKGISDNKMFVCQNINRNSSSLDYEFYPDIHFMGADKKNQMVHNYINFIETTISSDFTKESVFLGKFESWTGSKIQKGEVNMIDGIDIGVKNMNDKPIYLEDLLSDNYVNFYSKMYGILIPSADILKMRKYEWFSRLSTKQILEANTILSKYMVIASAPDSDGGTVETMKAKPKWHAAFWKVPSEAPVWGLKPNMLGDNLISSKEPFNYE
jgi:hypothetical protein